MSCEMLQFLSQSQQMVIARGFWPGAVLGILKVVIKRGTSTSYDTSTDLKLGQFGH